MLFLEWRHSPRVRKEWFEAAHDAAVFLKNVDSELHITDYLAEAVWSEGNWHRAMELFEDALELAKKVGQGVMVVKLLDKLARYQSGLGNPRQAVEYLEQSLENKSGDVKNRGHEERDQKCRIRNEDI